tara:strand:- start:819 stop:1445 length:627 start_codon:yes stop_codon:yes gene_type:complete
MNGKNKIIKLILLLLVSNHTLTNESSRFVCKAPKPIEVASLVEAKFVKTDDYFDNNLRTCDRNFWTGEIGNNCTEQKNLKYCRFPKDTFILEKINNSTWLAEERCNGGLTKLGTIVFEDEVLLEKFEEYYQIDQLNSLDYENKIHLTEERYLYQLKSQIFNTSKLFPHPLLSLEKRGKEVTLVISDFPEPKDPLLVRPRYQTKCEAIE